MKINLEYPYNKDWECGYIVTNRENRKTVILKKNKLLSSTSYARYIVATSLSRYLTDQEHVDHIDHDKTNDNLENLQILSQQDNNLKESKRKGRLLVEINCPYCFRIFTRRKGVTQLVDCNKHKITCCSKECSSNMLKLNLSLKQRENISKNSVIRVFRNHEKE